MVVGCSVCAGRDRRGHNAPKRPHAVYGCEIPPDTTVAGGVDAAGAADGFKPVMPGGSNSVLGAGGLETVDEVSHSAGGCVSRSVLPSVT